MGKLIDADRLKEVFSRNVVGGNAYFDLIDSAPAAEAIPKDQYKQRLKADMIAMLTEIQTEIEELATPPAYQDEDYFLIGTDRCSELIRQKIDALKGIKNGNDD